MYRILVNGHWLATGFKHMFDAIFFAEERYPSFTVIYCEEGKSPEIVWEV